MSTSTLEAIENLLCELEAIRDRTDDTAESVSVSGFVSKRTIQALQEQLSNPSDWFRDLRRAG